MSKNNQFFKVPNDMTTKKKLKPTDVLVYLYLKSYDNPEHQCFPSLSTLSKVSGAAINTIRTSIKRLEDNGYITIQKENNRHYYYFPKEKEFQVFSPEFLHNDELSFKEKSYIAASQQYMYLDEKDIGKISLTNQKLAKNLNISEDTLHRIDKSLTDKDLLVKVDTSAVDAESGCNKTLKIYKLKELGQAVLWQVKKNTDDIEDLKTKNDKLEKTCDILLKEVAKLKKAQNIQENLTVS